MAESAEQIAAIVDRLKGTGVRKVKIGDIEIEFDVTAPVTKGSTEDKPSSDMPEFPPELQDQTDEQMALFSSPCYVPPERKKS